MNKEFFQRKSNIIHGYDVKIKFCEWGMGSDICLARYKTGEYFLWIVGQEDKILTEMNMVISLIKEARKKKLLIPKGLIRRIRNEHHC